MSVTYHYWRYHSLYDEEIDTLLMALERVKRDVEYNEAAPEKIVLEDGTVLEYEEIMERSGYRDDTGPIVDGFIVVDVMALPSAESPEDKSHER